MVSVDRFSVCLVMGAASVTLWQDGKATPAPILVEALRSLAESVGVDIDRYFPPEPEATDDH
jgi:hypothetical protein